MEMQQQTDIALIKQDIGYIRDEIKSVNKKVSEGYASLSEFNALKARVDLFHKTTAYILVISGLGLLGAVMKLILK